MGDSSAAEKQQDMQALFRPRLGADPDPLSRSVGQRASQGQPRCEGWGNRRSLELQGHLQQNTGRGRGKTSGLYDTAVFAECLLDWPRGSCSRNRDLRVQKAPILRMSWWGHYLISVPNAVTHYGPSNVTGGL